MKVRSTLIALLLLAGFCFAADVDGKWSGTLSTPNGDFPVNFTLKADGATLTGSTTGPGGEEIKIANGKVDGNNISFSVTFDLNGTPLTINYKGVVAGQEIKFTVDLMGTPTPLTVKKTA
jgi:predicted ATP-grasp superfamily ATP-dependent carboligase